MYVNSKTKSTKLQNTLQYATEPELVFTDNKKYFMKYNR
jgi:hypothetical protein